MGGNSKSVTVVLGEAESFKSLSGESEDRDFRFFNHMGESLSFIIENVSIDSIVLDGRLFSLETMVSYREQIRFLNPQIKVILLSEKSLTPPEETECFRPDEDWKAALERIPGDKRRSHRVQWPVRATFWSSADPRHVSSGIVLSLSKGGCYIRTPRASDSLMNIVMNIRFKTFDFMVDGVVRRRKKDNNTDGLGIEFAHVSPATEDYIGEIINEKILGTILSTPLSEKEE